MLTVTESAGTVLAQILANENCPEDVGVRLVPQETGGLAMTLDRERPGDESFASDGRTVLVLDRQVAELLTEDTLDAEVEDGDARLVLRRGDGAGAGGD